MASGEVRTCYDNAWMLPKDGMFKKPFHNISAAIHHGLLCMGVVSFERASLVLNNIDIL